MVPLNHPIFGGIFHAPGEAQCPLYADSQATAGEGRNAL